MTEKKKTKEVDVSSILGISLDTMLRTAPENTAIRTHIMNVAKEPVPPDLKTYQDIAAWIITKVNKPATKDGRKESDLVAYNVSVEREEVGTCRYRRGEVATTRVNINRPAMIRYMDHYLEKCRASEQAPTLQGFSDAVEFLLMEQVEQLLDEDQDAFSFEITDEDHSSYDASDMEDQEAPTVRIRHNGHLRDDMEAILRLLRSDHQQAGQILTGRTPQ